MTERIASEMDPETPVKSISLLRRLACGRWVCRVTLFFGTLLGFLGAVLGIAVGVNAQNIVRRNDDEGRVGRPEISLMKGLELNPEILPRIKHNLKIADWSQFEIDTYYEILNHLKKSSSSELKKKASDNLADNIERYRKIAQKDHEGNLKKNQKLFQAKMKKFQGYKKSPSSFPSFAMLFLSVDKKNSYEYHGKLVTLSGRIQRLISYPARKNKQGIERLYEAWIYTEDSQHNPAVVVMTSKPEGMPEGENIYEVGTVTGIFYKMHVYKDAGDKLRKAPMILAHEIQWKPTSEKETSDWLYGILVGSVVLIIGVVIWLNFQDRQMRKAHQEIEPATSDLPELPI